jgi:hypothetical protein
MHGKSGSLSFPSRKINTVKVLSRKEFCDLCSLFVHRLVFIGETKRDREYSLS